MPTIEEKYQRYMETIKKANKKYIESHRDEVNAKSRIYYQNRLATNEEYKAKKREYNKNLYYKKKLASKNLEKMQESLEKIE